MSIFNVRNSLLPLVLGWVPWVAFGQCDFSDFPVMDDMKIYSVLEDAVHNNRPMMVKGYTSPSSPDDVAAYYHRHWEGEYANSQYGMWFQIGHMEEECLMTVQIAHNGDSSQGRLVISNVPQIAPDAELGEDLVMPVGSVVVQDLATRDGNKQGRVSVLACGESPSELAQFYLGEMDVRDWRLQQNFREDGTYVLVFRKGLDQTNILIMPAGEFTQVVINTEEIQ